jgi:hypothetical protein
MQETFRDAPRDAVYAVDLAGHEADQADKHAFEIDPIRSSGRILPSLIDSSPADTEPSRWRRRGAPRKDKPTKPPEVVATNVPKRRGGVPPPGHHDAGSMIGSDSASQQSPQARSNDSPRVASEAMASINSERSSVKSKAGRKPRRRGDLTKTHTSPQTAPLPIDDRPLSTSDTQPAMPSSNLDDGTSRERRRSIMARYVFGAELKPGERWKQRLRRAR